MPDASTQLRREAAPLRAQAVNALRTAIADGQFAPGERLKERAIIELLGTSRTVVREALRQLESEGLVTVVPNHGPAVARVTREEAEDLYHVRELLEGLASRLCADRATAGDRKRLRREFKLLDEAYRKGAPEAIIKVKERFYDVLVEGAHSTVLPVLMRSLQARIAFMARTSLAAPGRVERSRREVAEVVDAIEAANPDMAERLSRQHVSNAAQAALSMLDAGLGADAADGTAA